MKIQLKNIGPISEADIELSGLTVIGGLNNSGKSTVGKALFLIIKAFIAKEQEFTYERRGEISEITSELTSEMRATVGSAIGYATVSMSIDRALNSLGTQRLTLEEATIFISDLERRIIDSVSRNLYMRTHGRGNSLNPSSDFEIDPKITATVSKYLARIKSIISASVDDTTMYQTAFGRMINSVFQGEIVNKRFRSRQGVISLTDKNHCDIIKAVIKGKRIVASIDPNTTFEVFTDATFIESPFVLNNKSLIGSRFYNGHNDLEFIDYPSQDLIQKLNLAIRKAQSNSFENDVSNKIEGTIDGKVYFDSNTDDFLYRFGNSISIKIANTASGIKVLGILQMLANGGIFAPNSLLIIDEPEVHLHPEWQLIYAEIVAILVKNNVYCLVSSHSPYFIKALTHFSTKLGIQELTKFYLSNRTDEGVFFEDVSNDLEPIYKLLALPMQRLSFL